MSAKYGLIQSIRHDARGVRWCLGIAVTIGSAACAPSPDPMHQTVDYYVENREARQARLAECANDPGALGQTPDCINARQAAALESIGSLRDLPPMQLPTPPRQSDSTHSNDARNSSLSDGDKDKRHEIR
jgi:hypothetical protein